MTTLHMRILGIILVSAFVSIARAAVVPAAGQTGALPSFSAAIAREAVRRVVS